MKGRGFALAAAVAGVAALLPVPGRALSASALPDGVWAATASGVGTTALLDSQATGGAVFLANDSAPLAEATVTSAPASEAVGSYAYDRNAASGVYSIVSSAFQQNGGPALPPLPNTAFSRYPTGGRSEAGLGTDLTAEPVHVGAAQAVAETDAGAAGATVRTAALDLTTTGLFSTSAQEASATSRAAADGVRADATSRVLGISVAGEVLLIDEIRGESHASTTGTVNHAETAFQVLGARVNGIPVTIGADGIRLAGAPDATTPGLVASLNQARREQLASAGISMSLLEPVTSEGDGASASTPGLSITIDLPSQGGVPGGTVGLVLGRTAANASLAAPVLSVPPLIAPPVAPLSMVTTQIPIGGPVAPEGPAAALTRARWIPELPPVLMLFVLWQVWTLGWAALAWWRREIARGRP